MRQNNINRSTNAVSYITEMLKLYPEMLDVVQVIEAGRVKHGDTWLNAEGATMSLKDNCASLQRHLDKKKKGILLDKDSGLDHDLHIACRALMSYVRKKRGLVHPKDAEVSSWTIDDSNCLTVEENIEKNKGGQYMKSDSEDNHQL